MSQPCQHIFSAQDDFAGGSSKINTSCNLPADKFVVESNINSGVYPLCNPHFLDLKSIFPHDVIEVTEDEYLAQEVIES